MSRRAAWLAWSLWGLALACLVAATALRAWSWFALDWAALRPDWLGRKDRAELLFPALSTAAGLAYATVGALVASRVPGNRVGWLCLALGLLSAVGQAAEQYAVAAVGAAGGAVPTWPPAAGLAAWLANALLPLWLLPVTLLLLLFPDGRLPGRRWRWVAWTAAVSTGLLVLAVAAEPVLTPEGIAVPNPLRPPRSAAITALALTAALLALAAAGLAVVRRWRRAGGRERQQLKWLAYVAGLTGGAALGATISGYIAGASSLPTFLVGAVGILGFAVGVPVAIGLAVLRHHLYDIDVVIRRTLVYGVLTATLAGAYWLGVATLQGLAGWLTGQRESQVAVVASTLAIAALAQPLRRRLQGFIDRRFYRRRYDAAKTLAAFGARLRDETDLDRISADLLGVVQETMQPAHASLWLRPPEQRKGSQE